MTTTDRTDTPLERSAPAAPRRRVAAVHDHDLPLRLDAQLRPTLDTGDDPTGAAFAWPLMMLLVYAAAGLGFVVAR
jgi:hypothetical protein